MKKTDIKTGVVYAYRRGNYGNPRPMVFLSLGLHRSPEYGRGRWATPAAHDTKPRAGSGYGGSDVGYPVALGTAGETPIEKLASLGPDLIEQNVWSGLLAEAGITRDILTNMAAVLGPWDEVVAARKAQEARERERMADERRVRDAETAMSDSAIAALREHGIFADRYQHGGGGIRLSPHNSAKLAALLSDHKPEGAELCATPEWPATA
jgi:hypothetical protein